MFTTETILAIVVTAVVVGVAEYLLLKPKPTTPPTPAPKPTPPPAKVEKPKPNAEPIRMLALLQREGRLLAFLLADIAAYTDDQVGAAVRDIHQKCRKAVQEHLVLEPIIEAKEGDRTEVSAGFDPSRIRLVGNVAGQPPFQGTLQHHGWRVKEFKLPPVPEGQDAFVLQPAEVEIA